MALNRINKIPCSIILYMPKCSVRYVSFCRIELMSSSLADVLTGHPDLGTGFILVLNFNYSKSGSTSLVACGSAQHQRGGMRQSIRCSIRGGTLPLSGLWPLMTYRRCSRSWTWMAYWVAYSTQVSTHDELILPCSFFPNSRPLTYVICNNTTLSGGGDAKIV